MGADIFKQKNFEIIVSILYPLQQNVFYVAFFYLFWTKICALDSNLKYLNLGIKNFDTMGFYRFTLEF